MSVVQIAVRFVLRQEDSSLAGKVTTLKGDSGGATRFGIAANSHPELVARGYFDETKVDRDTALAIAISVYTHVYATPMRIADIKDQAVATAVFSSGINMWIKRPIGFLQQACGKLGHMVQVDEEIGAETLTIVNSLDPDQLLAQFSLIVKAYYQELVARVPDDLQFLHGWNNRVDAWTISAASLRALAAGQPQ